jgi:hypothetical protein
MSSSSSPTNLTSTNPSPFFEEALKRDELEEALDARLFFPDAHDNDKTHVNGLLKLHFWLADCKPPTAGSWLTFVNQLVTADDAGESLFKLTKRMVGGDFWRKQLTGWKELVACLLATLYLCKDNRHLCAAERILKAKKEENDRMRYAMWKRDFRKGEHEPLLENIPRKDICDESRWQLIHAWLDENCQHRDRVDGIATSVLGGYTSPLWELLDTLEGCFEYGRAPGNALFQLKLLGIPPGFKSSAEQKEAERLQRAMDAEREDDFDIGEVVDDGSETRSETRSETPLPMGETTEAVTKCGASPRTSRKRACEPEPAGEAILKLKLKIEKLKNKTKDCELEILKLGGVLSSSEDENED